MNTASNIHHEGAPDLGRPRTIGYLRVSTAMQAERGMGLDAQRHALEEYASEQGFELLETVEEAASGAAKDGELFSLEHRSVMASLVDRAERGEFDVLLVATLDRLSRDVVEQLYLRRLLGRYGVEVVSAAGETQGNGDAISELIERLIANVHDFDRKRILERMRSGKREARLRGRVAEGHAPYGFRSVAAKDNKGRTLEPVEVGQPAPADVVRWIFAEAKAGITPGRIAKELNRKDVPSPAVVNMTKAGPPPGWNRQTVRNILENDAYAGEQHGVKNAHPAIVSRRTFNAVQAALRSRARGPRAKGDPTEGV